MNFNFLRQETTKLGPQRIMVKRSELRKIPLLAVLSIAEECNEFKKLTKVENSKLNCKTYFHF